LQIFETPYNSNSTSRVLRRADSKDLMILAGISLTQYRTVTSTRMDTSSMAKTGRLHSKLCRSPL